MGVEKCHGSAAPLPIVSSGVVQPCTERLGPVEILVFGTPALNGRRYEGMRQNGWTALSRYGQWSARAMQRRLASDEVLRLAEVGEHVRPAPSGITQLMPTLEVATVSTHVDHGVDRARPTQDLAAWTRDRTLVQPWLAGVIDNTLGAATTTIIQSVQTGEQGVTTSPI